MLPNRIHLSKTASEQLKILKGRTGVTPNILARLALVCSLREGFDYQLQKEKVLDGLEFQMPTLLGEYALLYERILVELCRIESSNELGLALAAHIENGLKHFRGVNELAELVRVVQKS